MSVLSSAKVKLNGTPVPVVPGTVKPGMGGEVREAVPVSDGTVRYRVKPIPAKVTFDLVVADDTDLDLVNDFYEGTCEVLGDDGRTYVYQPATRTGDPIEPDSSDGKATVTIEGTRMR